MRCRLILPPRRRLPAFSLVASIVMFCTALFAMAVVPAIAEEGEPILGDWPIQTVPPAQLITHEKGSLHWTNVKPEPGTYSVDPNCVGELSPWEHTEDYYWENAFKVVTSNADEELPEFTAHFDSALTWVNPKTGETDPLDFECHFKGLEKLDDVTDPEVRMLYANGFYTVGLKHSQVTYKFYDHATKEPIDPGLLVYWCRSLNPGEGVGFSKSKNAKLNLKATYLTNKGLYDREFVNPETAENGHFENSSVVVSQDEDKDLLKFTGSNYLLCPNGVQIDIADSTEAFLEGCDQHVFEKPTDGSSEEPVYVVHGEPIPYSTYVQYRAVTFEVDPCEDHDAGLTLDYFSQTKNFYWDMEFNGIMVTRHLPTKAIVNESGVRPMPGDSVTFEVTQSLEDIPENLVTDLVFTDTLDERLEFDSAKMLIDGTEVPETAGTFEQSGQTLSYRFGDDGLKLLRYGSNASKCVFRITAKVKGTTAYEAEIPNRATVKMNTDEAETPEVTLVVGKKPVPDVSVKPGKGKLVIRKDVDTPNDTGVASVDQPVYYTVSVQNDSNVRMTNVLIEDSLPKGIVIIGDNPVLTDKDGKVLKEGTYNVWMGGLSPEDEANQIKAPGRSADNAVMTLANVDQWSGEIDVELPVLDAGEIVNIDFEAAVATGAPPTVTNTATAKADGYGTVSATALFKVRNPEPSEDPSIPDSGDQGEGSGSEGGDGSGGGGSESENPGGQNPGDGNGDGKPGDDKGGETKPDDGNGSGSESPGDENPGDGDTGGSGTGGSGQGGDTGGSGPSSGGNQGGSNAGNPSDADDPATGDHDNSGGGDGTGGSGDSGDADGDDSSDEPDGTGGGDASSGSGGTGSAGGSTSSGGTGGTGSGTGAIVPNGGIPSPMPGDLGAAAAPTALASDAIRQNPKRNDGHRRLPQTDAPPVIGIATTGGIGMTGALVAHSIWSSRNRRR